MSPAARLSLLVLSACPKPPADAQGTMVVGPAAAILVPAGRLVEDVYTDGRWPLLVTIPEGWTKEIGEDASEARIVLTDPEGDVRVTIAVTPGDRPEPRLLPGCTWTFEDVARYRAVRVPEPVLVGTCTPFEAAAPRILTYVVAREGVRWHIEGAIPPGHLRAGRLDLDEVAAGVRFR